mmetsp:Transcript_66083/g.182983  ORF Transcript_66083/g.182983 Transcript_66083/m.182983 type:complete len:173 (-) Transcript_66083:132-650(-)
MGQSATTLPGGWQTGDVAYFSAASQALPSGDKLSYGASGKVVGHASVKDGKDHQRVAVLFTGNSAPVACFTEALSREPPPTELPGGWRVGEAAVYTGEDKTFSNGDRLQQGTRCQVVGPAPDGGDRRVAVLCQGHAEPVLTSSLARDTSWWGGCTWCSVSPNRPKIVAIKKA